jgi:hypothetical protein
MLELHTVDEYLALACGNMACLSMGDGPQAVSNAPAVWHEALAGGAHNGVLLRAHHGFFHATVS